MIWSIRKNNQQTYTCSHEQRRIQTQMVFLLIGTLEYLNSSYCMLYNLNMSTLCGTHFLDVQQFVQNMRIFQIFLFLFFSLYLSVSFSFSSRHSFKHSELKLEYLFKLTTQTNFAQSHMFTERQQHQHQQKQENTIHTFVWQGKRKESLIKVDGIICFFSLCLFMWRISEHGNYGKALVLDENC